MRPEEPTLAVRYIGRSPYWKAKPSLGLAELDFESGQVRVVPHEVGRAFLRHSDLFEEAKSDGVRKSDVTETARQVSKALKEKDARADRKFDHLDLLVQVDRMDKGALEAFALERFRVRLDRRRSVENLRAEVRGYVDQYGVAA